MPKSAAQKCCEYTERQKERGKYEEYKAKEQVKKKEKRLMVKGKLSARELKQRRAED